MGLVSVSSDRIDEEGHYESQSCVFLFTLFYDRPECFIVAVWGFQMQISLCAKGDRRQT
jgi:hypothetical protein